MTDFKRGDLVRLPGDERVEFAGDHDLAVFGQLVGDKAYVYPFGEDSVRVALEQLERVSVVGATPFVLVGGEHVRGPFDTVAAALAAKTDGETVVPLVAP